MQLEREGSIYRNFKPQKFTIIFISYFHKHRDFTILLHKDKCDGNDTVCVSKSVTISSQESSVVVQRDERETFISKHKYR